MPPIYNDKDVQYSSKGKKKRLIVGKYWPKKQD